MNNMVYAFFKAKFYFGRMNKQLYRIIF